MLNSFELTPLSQHLLCDVNARNFLFYQKLSWIFVMCMYNLKVWNALHIHVCKQPIRNSDLVCIPWKYKSFQLPLKLETNREMEKLYNSLHSFHIQLIKFFQFSSRFWILKANWKNFIKCSMQSIDNCKRYSVDKVKWFRKQVKFSPDSNLFERRLILFGWSYTEIALLFMKNSCLNAIMGELVSESSRQASLKWDIDKLL